MLCFWGERKDNVVLPNSLDQCTLSTWLLQSCAVQMFLTVYAAGNHFFRVFI